MRKKCLLLSWYEFVSAWPVTVYTDTPYQLGPQINSVMLTGTVHGSTFIWFVASEAALESAAHKMIQD